MLSMKEVAEVLARRGVDAKVRGRNRASPSGYCAEMRPPDLALESTKIKGVQR